jgi:hypothetical protein
MMAISIILIFLLIFLVIFFFFWINFYTGYNKDDYIIKVQFKKFKSWYKDSSNAWTLKPCIACFIRMYVRYCVKFGPIEYAKYLCFLIAISRSIKNQKKTEAYNMFMMGLDKIMPKDINNVNEFPDS